MAVRRSRMLVAAGALLAMLAMMLVGSARAEMPHNNGAPEITGRVAVGEMLLGHNGAWLYDNGTACAFECSFAFRWERCSASECVTVSKRRGYRPRLADLHRELRVAVVATKYDCGAGNSVTGVPECRVVSRTAVSDRVFVDARARVAAGAVKWPAYLRIERTAISGRTLRVTVADTLGRLVRGARVSVAAPRRRAVRGHTGADGTAVLRLRAKSGRLVVAARTPKQVARIRLR